MFALVVDLIVFLLVSVVCVLCAILDPRHIQSVMKRVCNLDMPQLLCCFVVGHVMHSHIMPYMSSHALLCDGELDLEF